MELLKVYKNGTLDMQVFSVPHLIATLERECVIIKVKPIQGNEVARIQADNDTYTVYKSLK